MARNEIGAPAMAAVAAALADTSNALEGATLGADSLRGDVFSHLAPALASGTGLGASKLVLVRL
jgi:hypothetical protein